jgi:hypothetical protein
VNPNPKHTLTNLVPELPGIELVLGVLGVPEDEHDDALHVGEVLHQGLRRVGSVLQRHAVELALNGWGVFPFKHRGSKRPMRMLVGSGGYQTYQKAAVNNQLMDVGSSVADPDPYIFAPTGS